ncbi:hypothetical protein EYB31_26440 [Paenibacillus thalictri]|uniref:DUF3862 domain-containing protein n=1 Tax=Paenibacillus thalictri TaxID=2527873 RepID=A0A4Q9DLL0_9BACL|nr:hypothetical protein EYB31_26440 [Paenibacillus thalictri]
MTKAAFDKIETGATYEDVQKIVGGAGQKISETGKQGEPDYTETYQYKGDKPNSNAKFTFRDKKLSSKSQSMLD